MLKTKKQQKNGQWFRDQIRAFLLRNGATEQLNKAYEYAINYQGGHAATQRLLGLGCLPL